MRNALFLLIAAVAVAGCAAETPQRTPEPVRLRISPSVDSILVNESVDFMLVDTETGEPRERAGWDIISHHNVPGDRGVMRSDGRYTAPRIVPEPPTVRIAAYSGGRWTQAEFLVVSPDWPPEGTPRPGDGHLHPLYGAPPKIRTSRPIDAGLRGGESVRITAFDMTGRPLLLSHCEISHNDRVVDYAGTITSDYTGTITSECIYTAPSVVPDPPTVGIDILYFREGERPGSAAMAGIPVKILPSEDAVRKDVDEPTSQPERPKPTLTNTLTPEEMPEGVSPALARDARMYAEQHGVELSEAITRLLMQDTVRELENLLYRESDTFGGLWIQHEPEYRVVVAFTKDGEETIARYVQDETLMDLIQVRTVEATYGELMKASREADWTVREVGFRSRTIINVPENMVEVHTPDRSRLEEALRKNGKTLPALVHIVERMLPVRPEGG